MSRPSAGGGRPGQPRQGRRTGPRPPQNRRGAAAAPASDAHRPDGVRLQKLLAAAGIGSRRACEALMAAGRVSVDGQVVTELGTRIDPESQVVHVDGIRVQLDESKVYLAFNKPIGVVSTMSDERGRPSLADYVGTMSTRLFHVGRLDVETEGLILLTNDGELAHRLQHPGYAVPKTYLAQVPGPVPKDLGRRLRAGVELDDGPAAVDSFRVVDSAPGRALVEIVIHEGRNRIVRRMLEAVGHPVEALVRTDVGPVQLGQLRTGRYRALSRAEISALFDLVSL